MREQTARFLRGVTRDNPTVSPRALRRQFIGKSHKERGRLKRLGNGLLVLGASQDAVAVTASLRANQARVSQALRLPSVKRLSSAWKDREVSK